MDKGGIMATLISSVARLESRIKDYQKEAKEMAWVMPYARSWYALWNEKEWLFGPSKFVGYDNLNAKQYLESHRDGLDGRVTEGVLQKWSELVELGHPQYDELHAALDEFFARLGKKPNSLARISIIGTKGGEVFAGPLFPDDLVPLLVAVYRKLTPAQKSAFQKQAA
jgi:hypothetical protein